MFEDEGVEEGAGGFLLVLVEGGEGLELEPELLVVAALVLLKTRLAGASASKFASRSKTDML